MVLQMSMALHLRKLIRFLQWFAPFGSHDRCDFEIML